MQYTSHMLDPTTRSTILIIGIAIFFAAETFFPLREHIEEGRVQHMGRNVLFTLVNFVLLGIAYGSAAPSIVYSTQHHNWGLFNQVAWPYWLETALILLVLDLALYIWHIANHHLPILWRFHRVHHSDHVLDFTSATRFHVGELALSAVIRLGFVVLLGIDLFQLFLFELLVLLCAQFNHANWQLPKPIEAILRLLIVTPDMHQVHHSQKVAETNSNYTTRIPC